MVPLRRSLVLEDVFLSARAHLNRQNEEGQTLRGPELPNPTVLEGILPSGRRGMGCPGTTGAVPYFGPLGRIRFRSTVRARVQVPSGQTNFEAPPPRLSKKNSRPWYAMTEYPGWVSVVIVGG